jgi:tetratricopeptide (TPR) repeat protein
MDLSPLWLLGWRCLHALCLAVLPWALPLDVSSPASLDGAMLRALAGYAALALLVALAVSLVRARPRRAYAHLSAATLTAALVAAALLPRGALPLGASVWLVAPLAWATLFARASHVAAPSRRGASLAGLAALFALSAALAAPRVRSVEAMWSDVAHRTPAHAPAWRALIARASARGDRTAVRALLDRCLRVAPPLWECALDRAELALRDGDLAAVTRDAATVLAARVDHPRALVLRALGLARQVPVAPGAREAAQRAVERSPRSADAHLALALALDAAGRADEARTHAQTARTLGGGDDAAVLLSLLALRAGDAATARAGLAGVLRGDRGDARAYNTLGLVEQQAGRYNAAREAYLHALQIDRAYYAARYNLAALTFGAGASDEARHHLAALLRDHPGDAAGAALLRQIDGAPTNAAAALRPTAP